MFLLPTYKSLNNLKKEIEFDQFNIEKLDINWWMKKINKYKVEPIVDKIKVRISDTQLIQIENRFYKLRNRNARKKTIFTLENVDFFRIEIHFSKYMLFFT